MKRVTNVTITQDVTVSVQDVIDELEIEQILYYLDIDDVLDAIPLDKLQKYVKEAAE